MPFVHMLVRRRVERTFGWFSPVEIPDNDPIGVGFAIPIDGRGELFPKYSAEVGTYRDDRGAYEDVDIVDLQLVSRRRLRWQEPTRQIDLVELPMRRWRRLQYRGRFKNSHPDFSFDFIEVVPAVRGVLDEHFRATGRFLIGCSPFRQFRGGGDIVEPRE